MGRKKGVNMTATKVITKLNQNNTMGAVKQEHKHWYLTEKWQKNNKKTCEL